MDGAQLPLKKLNKKKEVIGKKPQQEVDPDSQSAAALHGGPCGSSGILNVSVGERGQEGEGGGEEKWGWFSWEWSQNQNQKQPVQRRTGGFHFHIILKFLRHFFRQIKPRGQEAACVNKLVLNKHTNTQIHKNDFPPGRSLQGTAIHATAPPAWPEINHAAFGWMLFQVKWKNVHFSWKPGGFFVSLAAESGCSGPVGYWPVRSHTERTRKSQWVINSAPKTSSSSAAKPKDYWVKNYVFRQQLEAAWTFSQINSPQLSQFTN